MKNLVYSVIIAFVSITSLSSCDKEYVKPVEQNPSEKKKGLFNKDGGGDDDDFIIIYGLTQDVSTSPISGAQVIVFDGVTTNPVDTAYSNSLGELEFELEEGSYYFKACATGYQTLETSATNYTEDTNVVFTLSNS